MSIKFPWRACAAAVLITTPVLLAAHAPAQESNQEPREKASERIWRHGLSLFGELKYPPGFKHFDYVNPNAPKGGTVRMTEFGTYDNFNPMVAGVKGTQATGVALIFETLLVGSLDEVSTDYGLLAESVSHPDDFASVTYRLRATAKWHDGKPVTPEDVVFSFDSFKTNHPQYAAYYQHVLKAEKTGDRDVTFTFDAEMRVFRQGGLLAED